MKQGDKVVIEGVIDACRTGFKKEEYRVKIGEVIVWIPADKLEVKE